jgi:NADPH2:quinone reductase
MKAAFYERFGAAEEVLQVGESDTPRPGSGEVLVRVAASGVNPSDVKLRAGQRPGAEMPYARIIPHSDGAGVIEAVGPWADRRRVGQRVWLWNAQWRRAMGTASEYVSLPADQAAPLPGGTSFEAGATLGIPAMTAWAAVCADGPVEGRTVLVTGGAGAVGRYAVQMAKLSGARVIATVSSPDKAAHVVGADLVVDYRRENVVRAVNDFTYGAGVDRVVEVDFGANLADSAALIREGGTIVAYASMGNRTPALPFYDLMFRNVTLRMLLVYLLDPETRRRGVAQITRWLEAGALDCAVGPVFALDEVAAAHAAVEAGGALGTVVVRLP